VAKPKAHKLTTREMIQVVAALRYWGRAAETNTLNHPSTHPMVAARFFIVRPNKPIERILPLSQDELETLIGKLDGSWTSRGLRTWNPLVYR